MIDELASIGASYNALNFYATCAYLLAKNVVETKKFVNSFRETWKSTSCVVMVDSTRLINVEES